VVELANKLISSQFNPAGAPNSVLDYIQILHAMNGVNALVSYERKAKKTRIQEKQTISYPDSQSGVGVGCCRAAPFLGEAMGRGGWVLSAL